MQSKILRRIGKAIPTNKTSVLDSILCVQTYIASLGIFPRGMVVTIIDYLSILIGSPEDYLTQLTGGQASTEAT